MIGWDHLEHSLILSPKMQLLYASSCSNASHVLLNYELHSQWHFSLLAYHLVFSFEVSVFDFFKSFFFSYVGLEELPFTSEKSFLLLIVDVRLENFLERSIISFF